MQKNILEDILDAQINQSLKIMFAFLGGVFFAAAGLAFLMSLHIMQKSIGVCIIALLVFSLAMFSQAKILMQLRSLRKMVGPGKSDDIKSALFYYRDKEQRLILKTDAALPVSITKVSLRLHTRHGKELEFILPSKFADKLHLAIKEVFPSLP
ncbi:hypothetical protein ACO0LC_02870 [Undibacterium sp. JH2W]|uniref:hypothetical protein n=1 Tax=Undibacterium sp. JH2W TaxID=3413037 RepID=UPI003BF273B1